ncbi:MAG TPA: hypothetical protein VF319_17880, partial [Caldimonas sp.]
MSVRFSAAATLCVAALIPVSAVAADDLQSIRQQIDQLKADYEGRIQALEARLQTLQQRVAAPAPAVTPTGGAAPASAAAFNPAISLILNGTYANL